MIVQCKKCKARYKIDDRRVKTTGSKVRCSKCGHVFFVMVEEESDDEFNSQPEEGFSSVSVQGGEDKRILKDRLNREQKEHKVSHPSSQEELKNGSTEQDENTFDWEGLINISGGKEGDVETSHDMESDRVPEDEKEEGNLGFSWENLSVDREIEEPVVETPKLFNDTADEEPRNSPPENQSKPEHHIRPERHTMDMLSVDIENLPFDQKRETRHSTYFPETENPAYLKLKQPSYSSSIKSGLKKAASALFTLVFFVIIVAAGTIVAMNVGLIPKDQANKITSFALSKLPLGFLQTSAGVDLVISDQVGRWVSTRNGYIYVVSGNVANRSEFIVNYIKLKSEFMSGGKKLFQQVVYAGNVFTEEELETLSFEEIEQRLNTKNGDIDFYNHRKLSGLNYNIQPGESVPFFTVFPAESKVLGLKYDVDIMDFEKVELE